MRRINLLVIVCTMILVGSWARAAQAAPITQTFNLSAGIFDVSPSGSGAPRSTGSFTVTYDPTGAAVQDVPLTINSLNVDGESGLAASSALWGGGALTAQYLADQNEILITAPPLPSVRRPFVLGIFPGQSHAFYTYAYLPLGLQDTALDATVVGPPLPVIAVATPTHLHVPLGPDPASTMVTDLIDVTTGKPDILVTNAVATAMGFEGFDWIQLATLSINGQPVTPSNCPAYISRINPGACEGGVLFDTPLPQGATSNPSSPATSLYNNFAFSSIPERFVDDPCAPAEIQMNFTDYLVGVNQNGNDLTIIQPNQSPYIQGPTSFQCELACNNDPLRGVFRIQS